MIEYVNTEANTYTVKLDGRVVGHIDTCAGMWRYTPKGGKPGNSYVMLRDLKNELEGD